MADLTDPAAGSPRDPWDTGGAPGPFRDESLETPRRVVGLGGFPFLSFVVACGVAAVSVADALARAGRVHGELLWWIGLVIIFVPVVGRLMAESARRGERVALVVLLGCGLYAVKVIRDPFGFTYADELVHQYNAMNILGSGALLHHNPILAVTPYYPGLETFTASLASLTHTSTFVAGLIVIGAARVLAMLALFLLFETLTGSSRVAGLGTAIYAATPNFLFFSAQFSYESLALPLGAFAAFAAIRSSRLAGSGKLSWRLTAALLVVTIVVTHHLTSYALFAFLAGTGLVAWLQRRRSALELGTLAGFTLSAIGAWLILVASATVGYLSPVISRAISATVGTVASEQAPRALFTSTSGTVAPGWERLVGLGGAFLVLVAVPLAWWRLWPARRSSEPALVVLGLAGIGYVASYGLRLVPAAWETGARASEFLFAGGSLVVALAVLNVCDRWRGRAIVWIGALASTGVIFIGGVVSGSATGFRVAQPYRVAVDGVAIDPPAAQAAAWFGRTLHGPRPVAAQQADARLFLVYGDQNVVTGSYPDIIDVLGTAVLYRWQVQLLRRLGVRYVVVDTRKVSGDVSTGYFFATGPAVSNAEFSMAIVTKFERAGADRVFDNGEVRIDDLSTLRPTAATP